ncbi:hypothetical protein [Haloferax denitrificans]|uniref:hypothetical protein n=1 Tax=Haloferax denitrificans TaxID=35745 RepID=UPI003C6F785A
MSWEEQRDKSAFNQIHEVILNNPGYFLAIFVLLGPLIVYIVNKSQNIELYQTMMLYIAWNQAAITGYLSFKIYSVGKRDSELPELRLYLNDAEEIENGVEGKSTVFCKFKLQNDSFGRAKIRDVSVSPLWRDVDIDPSHVPVQIGFPKGKRTPEIVDKGDTLEIQIQIDGFSYLDEFTIKFDEESLGEITRKPMLSDIWNIVMMKREVQN